MSTIESETPVAVDAPVTFDQPESDQPSRSFFDRTSKWMWFWGGLFAACVPLLIPYFADMWAAPHYQYFPFVFLAVGALIYTRSDRQYYPPAGWLGWSLVVLGIATLALAIVNQAVWLGGFAFVLIGIAFVASLRGDEDISLLALGFPLLMLVKLPLNLDTLLIQNLQNLTTELSSVMLDVFGVSHAIEGNIIKLADRELFVAEACSGIQSVFTLAFLASLLVAFLRRRLWLAPFYLAIAILLAVAGNVVRVTTVALAAVWNGTDLSSGISHDILGYTTLALAAALLLSFDQLIITLLHPVEFTSDGMLDNPLVRFWNFLVSDAPQPDQRSSYRSFDESESRRYRNQQLPGWMQSAIENPLVRYGFVGVAGLLMLASIGQLVRMQSRAPTQTVHSSDALFAPAPDMWGDGFEIFQFSDHTTARDGNNPRLGENADLWQVQVGELVGQVVLSQPYSGWHELCVCYQNLDWELVNRDVVDDVDIKVMPELSDDESFVTARFKRPGGQEGLLMFSAVSYDGSIPSSPGSFGAFGSRLFGRLDRNGIIDQTDIMMFQFWLPTPKKLDNKVIRQLQEEFVKARAVVAKNVVNPDSASVAKPEA
ncbi:exosortase U [Crateriforma conspicua]|uniref:exosortase U n=1 Tax=Crateriforma conspicua TaxID=2527996 RepID=UPI00118AE53D|nr:exosortase U [Crateriforma conspicua]QDV63211.1 Transmembrane exosortase (Exosortase_EpsH) [Crateriforma conspicua]